MDGNVEVRKGTISIFNGPSPDISIFEDQQSEEAAVGDWIRARLEGGVVPEEIGVIVRSGLELARAKAACTNASTVFHVLDNPGEWKPDSVAICTMHLAKGLAFRAVVVMAYDDEVLPLQSRIESVVDGSDLEEVYATERHLLYVACTRARVHLLVSGVEPASEFLSDLVQ